MEVQTIISSIIAIGGALGTLALVLLRFGAKDTATAMKIEALEKTDAKQSEVLDRLDRSQTLASTAAALQIAALEKTDVKQAETLDRLDRSQTSTGAEIKAIQKQQRDDSDKHANEITNLREAMAASEGRIVEAISDVKSDIRALRGEDKKPPDRAPRKR